MTDQVDQDNPTPVSLRAVKHGGYAETLLPGEDVTQFEGLHRSLVLELDPSGAVEDDIVASMARLLWRKQHLAEFRTGTRTPGHAGLMYSLELEDRLDSLIDKCLKRLLFVRGVKTVASGSMSASSPRLIAPTKVA